MSDKSRSLLYVVVPVLVLFAGGLWYLHPLAFKPHAFYSPVEVESSLGGGVTPEQNPSPAFEQISAKDLVQKIQDQRLKVGLPPAQELQGELATLSAPDFKYLRDLVLQTGRSLEEREVAVFLLTKLNSAEARETLALLAESTVPRYPEASDAHSVGATQRLREVGLRITALESLDLQAADHPELKDRLTKILHKQKEPSLKFLAETSLSGLQSGKPGRLRLVIDKMLGGAQ